MISNGGFSTVMLVFGGGNCALEMAQFLTVLVFEDGLLMLFSGT